MLVVKEASMEQPREEMKAALPALRDAIERLCWKSRRSRSAADTEQMLQDKVELNRLAARLTEQFAQLNKQAGAEADELRIELVCAPPDSVYFCGYLKVSDLTGQYARTDCLL
jgi:hypothetical protein